LNFVIWIYWLLICSKTRKDSFLCITFWHALDFQGPFQLISTYLLRFKVSLWGFMSMLGFIQFRAIKWKLTWILIELLNVQILFKILPILAYVFDKYIDCFNITKRMTREGWFLTKIQSWLWKNDNWFEWNMNSITLFMILNIE